MLWVEMLAAALVGIALVVLVLAPLLSRQAPDTADDEPEDFEETPQGVALAALKEIEFDRATGKLSDDDYAFLKQKYTQAALEAMRAAEGAARPAPAAADVDAMIAARAATLRAAGDGGGPACPACGPRPESDALFCSSCGATLADASCAGCGAALAPGSRFCEGCGRPVGGGALAGAH